MKLSLTVLFLLIGLQQLWSQQYQLLFNSNDTITYKERVLTERQDSVHVLQSGYTMLNPGGNQAFIGGELQDMYAENYRFFQQNQPYLTPLKSVYAGLPHLGFYYSFGSRGIQNIRLDYQHTISKVFNIHLRYIGNHLSKDAGFLRNSGYSNNAIQLLMNYNGSRYKGQYYFDYYYGQRRSSDRLSEDSLLLQNAIQLIPVENESAFSKLNFFDAGTQHQIFFTRDSVVRQGFIYQNRIDVQNRKYSELGNTLNNYGAIYWDSTETYDQYQWSQIRNEAGYFLQLKNFGVAAKAFHQYWRYDNRGMKDTSEVGIAAETYLRWEKIRFQSELDMTFLGAIGELKSYSTLNWKIIENLSLNANLLFENKYPSVFLRSYQGNSIQWNNSNLKLQQTLKVGGEIVWKTIFPVKASVNFANLSNHYWLVDSQLRNDTLNNVALTTVSLKADFKFKTFHLDPYFAMNLTSSNAKFAPLIDARLNMYWNQKLFSTKKFDFILGATARYQTKVDLLSYNHLVDLYQFTSTAYSYQPILRLDVFTGFQIDNIRFFLRYENLDAFWNNRRNFNVLNYPIAPGVIHVGLTWDFFN